MDAIKSKGVKFTPEISVKDQGVFLNEIQTLLVDKRNFIVNLLENPNLMEKDNFLNCF